jgi:pilus assembly protein CpaB
MSSTLRVSIIMVLLLATAALGLIAYNNMNPLKAVVQVTENTPAPPTTRYFVAAHPLPVGTLARDEDFDAKPLDSAPSGAFLDAPDAKIRLRGSLVRKFLDTGSPVTSQDVLRPGDRGFLASILKPGTRAISINVDAESGVSSLIRPGDYVDVVLTQEIDKADLDKADLAHRAYGTLSETVLHNVRIIAIDQEIVQGEPANNAAVNNAAAGKPAHPVSLELEPEQVKKIAVAKHLGTLSLAIQAKVEQQDTGDTGTMFSRDVSPEIARQSACQSAIARQSTMVVVYAGGKVKEYSVKKHDSGNTGTMVSCDGSPEVPRQSATVVGDAGDKVKEYSVSQGNSDER